MFWESNILLKFIFGKCTKAEVMAIDTWLLESDQNRNTLSHLKNTVKVKNYANQ